MERVPPMNQKRKPGRPSSYRPEYCQRIIELGKEGKSITQMAVALGTLRDQLYDWARMFPEFSAALKRARECAQSWWEDAGQTGIYIQGFQQTAYIFQMKNRFREDYYDQSVITGLNGQPLTTTPPPLVINFYNGNKRPGDDAKLIEAKPT